MMLINQLALQVALDRMAAPSVQDVLDGNVTYEDNDITIIAIRNGRGVASYVADASTVQWQRLLPTDRIVRGKLPNELIQSKED